jgi:HAAS
MVRVTVTTRADTLVDRYLTDLEAELAGLPADRRREILDEVGEHIAAARDRRRHLPGRPAPLPHREGTAGGGTALNCLQHELPEARTCMAHCVTCGSELHPERAERYTYCTRRECREQNAKPLTIAAVAVNKAADQYLVLDERTREDLAAGSYQDARKSAAVTGGRPPERTSAPRATAPRRRPSARKPEAPKPTVKRPAWTRPQEDLAAIYSAQGMRPDEIAERIGVSRYTATQMVLAAKRRLPR